MSKTALILIAPGFEEVEAITPIDLLRRAGITVVVAGLHDKTVEGAHGITIQCDTTLHNIQHQHFDAVILPGGMPGTINLRESDLVHEVVLHNARENKVIAAICAAPTILNEIGILKDTLFTCYPGVEQEIKYGKFVDNEIVIDKNIITARSAAVSIHFSLTIIEALIDTPTADEVANKIVHL